MSSNDIPPAVEVYAETRLEVSAERSFLNYQWKGHGLRIEFPEGTTASLHIKAVWSNSFKLPKGTELVSPVYWLSYEGKIGGLVGVELQHCAQVREERQRSGLSFAVCKVEKAEPPYQFELCKCHFSSRSTHGRMEMGISRVFVAIVRKVVEQSPEQPTADPMFLAKLYYEQQQLSATTAHIMIVPHLDMSTTVGAWVCTSA